MEVINKDILDRIRPNKKTIVIHGCNCFCTMGAGIAKYLMKQYPIILRIDQQTKKGDMMKLGTYTVARITDNFIILNCYTQYDYRRQKGGEPPVDYDAIALCLKKIRHFYPDWEIRSPKIGCGRAGGDWNKVDALFESILYGRNVKIYEIEDII